MLVAYFDLFLKAGDSERISRENVVGSSFFDSEMYVAPIVVSLEEPERVSCLLFIHENGSELWTVSLEKFPY